jgi:glycosyltransferase 2 family protein
MQEKIKSIIRIIAFASIGIFLFWLVYKDQPVDQIITALKGANYFYISLSLVLAFLSHLSRAMRWNILINSMGHYPKLTNTLFSIFIMYLSNTAIPRSGEVVRCGVLKKYENVPFSQLLGTVIIERAFDFLMLFILLAVVLLTQFGVIGEFIEKNPETGKKLEFLFNMNTWLIIFGLFVITVATIYFLRNKMNHFILVLKIKEFIRNIFEGIKTVKKLEKKWQFIFHSVFIYIMYFVMLYVVFLSFDFTSHLSMMTGLTVFVMASFGMVAPSPGGIGTWHFMVIETLVIYGVQKTPDANAFAFAAHGSMTLLLIVGGLISLILLPIYNKSKKEIVS